MERSRDIHDRNGYQSVSISLEGEFKGSYGIGQTDTRIILQHIYDQIKSRGAIDKETLDELFLVKASHPITDVADFRGDVEQTVRFLFQQGILRKVEPDSRLKDDEYISGRNLEGVIAHYGRLKSISERVGKQ